ncbi:GGDEF domain-containing response regulator [Alkalilimnicola sp. S0819]|uniref:GGDEF domain-containing response regulator n=1 Tax=Alkalilimnicola sp. S0819 TaxID=2613922 RepID=UPI001262382B|nr:GGDEF domain-containing response regulator [Alkalilimnicola sp. S0819]KAB7627530.1 EAL domain-containing protein [Alkalilimnicola sp. S0819]MPQ15684.1 EAL domain-containing protein [Alkalilimnicola sp. S0819]
MHRVLVIELSATLRHGLNKMLSGQDYQVSLLPSFEQGLSALGQRPEEYDAAIIGWPSRTDPTADELFSLLESPRFKSLAVVVLSEEAEAAKLNWVTKRPSTAMLLWADFHETVDSLRTLLSASSLDNPCPPPAKPAARDAIRVLFVDDSPTVRVSYRRLLNRHGYETDTASSVREGMDLASRNPYDIAIIDYFMPDATGDELCRQLRDNPDTAGVTSSIITGTYLDKVIKDSLDAGAVECMFKNEAEALFLARVAAMSRSVLSKRNIERERRRLEGILGSVGDGVYGVDNNGLITFMNTAAREILGFGERDKLNGCMPHTLFHHSFQDGTQNPPETCFLTRAYGSGDRLLNWQTVFWNAQRRPVPVECTVYPLHIDGHREGSVVAFRDVSERKLMEEELRWQANHDPLTKLLNRSYFESQLEQEVARLQRNAEHSALLYLDLDQFKYINDTAGHAAGDKLLVEIGQQLQTRLRASDTLARLGGDEFAVILRNVQPGEAYEAAEAFREILVGHTFQYAGKSYKVNGSVGVANLDQYTKSPGEALANADVACHIAKEKGRNRTHIYAPESDQRRAMDLELGWSARLHDALENDLFELAFHPIIGIDDMPPMSADADPVTRWRRVRERIGERAHHYEVLLRLRGGEGPEWIMPDAFLPTAERFNLMPRIDRWVTEKAIASLAEAHGRGMKIRLSVNLSGHTVVDRELAGDIKALLEKYAVDPSALTFEITESCAITNLDSARRLMDELHAIGCQFALDDFGSGFCSFGHLKNLAVDVIKIDGLFTQGLVTDPIDLAVVQSIVEIAHALGKRTVAEYVENQDILAQLKRCGVDYVQGNFIAQPLERLEGAPLAGAMTAS